MTGLSRRGFLKYGGAVLGIGLTACNRTVERDIKEPRFQAQNRPIRELHICAVLDGSYSSSRVEQCIAEFSELGKQEVGIIANITRWQNVQFRKDMGIEEKAEHMILALTRGGVDQASYDIAVGFTKPSSRDYSFEASRLRFKAGFTDPATGRFIIMNSLNRGVLLHEILCHTFRPFEIHSKEGLCFYEYEGENYLSAQDRHDVLVNKWRKF